MKYESVTQKVLLSIESILQNAEQLQHVCLSWHIRFENYGPRRLQNNLESPCIFTWKS
jgi:hypothetical protein